MIQPLNEWMDGIGMPYISREPPARKITSRRAPPYGFSKYSGIGWEARTKPPSIRHPGSFRAFRDIRVPEFLDIGRNIRKSHMPAQNGFGSLPGRRLIYVLWLPFMPAAGTAVHSPPGTHKACQKGKTPLACSDVGGAASGAFHSVDRLCATGFLLLYLGFKLAEFELIFDRVFFF